MRLRWAALAWALGPAWLPAAAQAQEAVRSATDPQAQSAEQRLEDLKATQKELQRLMHEYDARISALEAEIKAKNTAMANAARQQTATAAVPAPSAPPVDVNGSATRTATSLQPSSPNTAARDEVGGRFEAGKGFVVTRGSLGEISLGVVTYARYINQLGLAPTYTDSFERTLTLDRRQDVMLNKVSMTFKGWLFSPDLSYTTFVWTQNSSQGLSAQVEVAGNIGYHFNEYLRLSTGVAPLPTTRSTNWTYPLWLRNDNRTLADEYFRGNFTFGVWADGKLGSDVGYRLMIGNNLNQIGVDASQIDSKFATVAAALWWMPTTGEYGPGLGFGDSEYHEQLATLFGIHFTTSREDKQAQSGVNAFENSQIRLSDGTLLFSPNAFDTGGQIDKATYQMLDLNAGFKYRGWSLEGEFYFRRLDDFRTTGFIPVTDVSDHGFQLQASKMIIPKELQAYLTGSRVFGQYGNPWDASAGFNWYPYSRHEFRINAQANYLHRSPVGNLSITYAVGGTGWVYNADVIIAF